MKNHATHIDLDECLNMNVRVATDHTFSFTKLYLSGIVDFEAMTPVPDLMVDGFFNSRPAGSFS